MKKQHFQTIFKTGTAILLCGIALTGCGTKNQQNATANITTVGNTALEQPMRLEALKDDGTDYQAYWGTKIQCITRGEHGYYYLTPEEPLYLMYWDDDTQESIKLCAKADCNHDNAACNAYFGDVRYYDRTAQAAEYASGFQIYYYNGFLYLLGTEGNLIQVSPDGSERKRITKVYDYDGTSNTKLVFYENAVYVYNSAGNQGSSEEHTETITRYTLDGKSQERVVEWNSVSGAIHSVKNYGNTMFFLLSGLTINKNESGQEWTYIYQGLYAYNHQTGQSGKIIDAEITSYAVDEEQEQIYYFAYADGLYVYDIKTEQTRKLYDAGKEMGIAEMSYDGKYLYLYNGEWVSYAKSNEKTEIARKCIVLATDGTVLYELPINKAGYMLFGNGDYIFAEQIVADEQQQAMKLTYMKKTEFAQGQWQVLE